MRILSGTGPNDRETARQGMGSQMSARWLPISLVWAMCGMAGCQNVDSRLYEPRRTFAVDYGTHEGAYPTGPSAHSPAMSGQQAGPMGLTPVPETTPAPKSDPQRSQAEPEDKRQANGGSPFPLRAGDRLELLYTQTVPFTGDYRLMPGDEIRVENLQAELPGANRIEQVAASAASIDRRVRIQPDGKVALPYVGVIKVAGASIPDLTERLTERYREFYVEPQILVSLVQSGSGIRDLRESIRTAGSRLVVIAPDGTINVPHLGVVNAEGLTLTELQTELGERYQRVVPGLGITVRLAGRTANPSENERTM